MLLRSLEALPVGALGGFMACIFLFDTFIFGPTLFVNDERLLTGVKYIMFENNETPKVVLGTLGPSGAFLGLLGTVLGGLRSLFGPFGKVLRESWGDLGASGSGLGASWKCS